MFGKKAGFIRLKLWPDFCNYRRDGYDFDARFVFEEAMKWAADHGAGRLFIISNSKLAPALHIYVKFGFQEIKLDDYEYERGDIAFEKMLR